MPRIKRVLNPTLEFIYDLNTEESGELCPILKILFDRHFAFPPGDSLISS